MNRIKSNSLILAFNSFKSIHLVFWVICFYFLLTRLLSLRTFKTSRWKRFIFLMYMYEIRTKDKLRSIDSVYIIATNEIYFEQWNFCFLTHSLSTLKFIINLNSVFLALYKFDLVLPLWYTNKTEEYNIRLSMVLILQ